MSPADAAKLLALCAVFDNRKPETSGMAAHAWAEALDDLDFTDCRLAIVEHFRHSSAYILPADIRARVEERHRRQRLAEIRAQQEQQIAWQDRQPSAAECVPMPSFVRETLTQISRRRQCEHGCLETSGRLPNQENA